MNDRVEQGGDADVVQGRAAGDGDDRTGHHPFPETRHEILGAEFAALEVSVHQLIVGLGDIFDQDVTVSLGIFGHVGGNIDRFCRFLVAVKMEGLHGNQIHDPGKSAFGADGKGEDRDLLPQAGADAFHRFGEVGALPIHPADEEEAGKLEFVGILPDLFRLKFDAPDGVDEDHGPVHDPEAAFRVKSKIGITGRVDDVDPVFFPFDVVCGGADRDMSLLFLRFIVHGGGSFINPAGPVCFTGHVEN